MDERFQPIFVVGSLSIIIILMLIIVPPPAQKPLPHPPSNVTAEKASTFATEYEQIYKRNQIISHHEDVSAVTVTTVAKTVNQTSNGRYVVVVNVHTEIRQGTFRLRGNSADYSISYRVVNGSFTRGINRTQMNPLSQPTERAKLEKHS